MNKEYIYLDGKIIVSDENENKSLREYSDNLEEILIQENIIETMENRIQELENMTNINKINKRYIPLTLPILLLSIYILLPAIFPLFFGNNVSNVLIDSIFGSVTFINFVKISLSIACIPLGTIGELANYKAHKNNIKDETGNVSELEYLKKQIIEEKEHLSKLKQDKSKINENKKFRSVRVNDIEELKKLKSYLELYYDLGYNDEKYYNYYKQGKLVKKLKKHYTNNEIELAKKYLDEKETTFIKK